jgi:hypothetical protein
MVVVVVLRFPRRVSSQHPVCRELMEPYANYEWLFLTDTGE